MRSMGMKMLLPNRQGKEIYAENLNITYAYKHRRINDFVY